MSPESETIYELDVVYRSGKKETFKSWALRPFVTFVETFGNGRDDITMSEPFVVVTTRTPMVIPRLKP